MFSAKRQIHIKKYSPIFNIIPKTVNLEGTVYLVDGSIRSWERHIPNKSLRAANPEDGRHRPRPSDPEDGRSRRWPIPKMADPGNGRSRRPADQKSPRICEFLSVSGTYWTPMSRFVVTWPLADCRQGGTEREYCRQMQPALLSMPIRILYFNLSQSWSGSGSRVWKTKKILQPRRKSYYHKNCDFVNP